MNASEMTLARYYAKQAVKEQRRAAGLKPQDFEFRELAQAADGYLSNHPELITFASERYRSLVATGRLRPSCSWRRLVLAPLTFSAKVRSTPAAFNVAC
jgi:hypothetical protein